MDIYLKALAETLLKKKATDIKLAVALSKQLIRLCQVEKSHIFSELSDSAKKLIRLLVAKHPLTIWKMLADFYLFATPVERYRLDQLTGQSSGFDGNNHF